MYLENDYLKVNVTSNGGSMTSIYSKKEQKEFLYQPKPDSWSGQDIFIFPFIARLRDGSYTHNGQTYELKNHGLIRYMGGHINGSRTALEVIFKSSQETLKRYPFEFNAKIAYELEKSKIKISYDIINLSSEEMPYSIGAHPAFCIPGIDNGDEFDISGNKIVFDDVHSLDLFDQDPTASFMTGDVTHYDRNEFNLTRKLFQDRNTIIIDAKDINSATLYKKDGHKVIVNCSKANFVALWSDKKRGDYVCIEPWTGLPDYLESPKEIDLKPTILKVAPGKHATFEYEIVID